MSTPPTEWLELFQLVAAGKVTAESAAASLDPAAMVTIEGATVDLGRAARCGFGEVIYGEGKSPELIQNITEQLLKQQAEVLVTRCDSVSATMLTEVFPHTRYETLARTLRIGNQPIDGRQSETGGRVAVVCAGSTDLPVAREASETLQWMGINVETFDDLGVAGPQRLLSAVEPLRRAQAIVVVAGMEGALPSAVAGHVAVPVIAVPTSVGYGAALGGMTALMGMLISCAANVSVVNIDAGFKGGYVAGLIARQVAKAAKH